MTSSAHVVNEVKPAKSRSGLRINPGFEESEASIGPDYLHSKPFELGLPLKVCRLADPRGSPSLSSALRTG